MASENLKFKTEVELQFETDRYNKVNDYGDYDYSNFTYLDWEIMIDARSWGIKDLSFLNLTKNIVLEVDYEVDSLEKDKYGFPVSSETKTDVINIPLNNDNVEKIYTPGFGFAPYRLEIEEINGEFEIKIYISSPGGIQKNSSIAKHKKENKMNIKLSARDKNVWENKYNPENFDAESNSPFQSNLNATNLALELYHEGYHSVDGIVEQFKLRNYKTDEDIKNIIKAVIEKNEKIPGITTK